MTRHNLHRIPQEVIERIRRFDQDDIVVACVKLVQPNELDRYSHLGLKIEHGTLIIPDSFVPNPSAGRYSRANVAGFEKVRKDLPKVSKEFEFEAPDWGDWSRGSHTVSWTRQVYKKDFYPPKEVELSITLLEIKNERYLLKFAIEQVLNRRTKNFEQELFYNLNLLQENVGAADVYPSAATLAQYLETIRVDWVILPPGTVDEIVTQILKRKNRVTADQLEVIKKRLSVMHALKPEAYVAGTEGFLRYFGAKFGDDFVVFENIRYGNAIYVMHESWQELSRKSRVELLSGPRDSFERIEHRPGWNGMLKAKVMTYRAKQKPFRKG